MCLKKKKDGEKEGETRNRSENLHRSTPLEEAGPVWLVRRCETLAANAVVLDNMWSKPVADRSEAKIPRYCIIARGERASLLDRAFETKDALDTNLIPFSLWAFSNWRHFLFIHVFIAYIYALE